MSSIIISVFALIGLVFTCSSGIFSESYSTLDGNPQRNMPTLDGDLLNEIDNTHVQDAAQTEC